MSEENDRYHAQRALDDKQWAIGEKPWRGDCCRRCYLAKTDKAKCKCRCNGLNHQRGRKAEQQIKEKQSSIREFCQEPRPIETKGQ